MPVAFLLVAALAAGQMGSAAGHGHWAGRQPEQGSYAAAPTTGRGRAFISPMGEPFHGSDGLTAWFQQADRNHDGSLTLDEFNQDAQRFFDVLDTNHDGQIDPDEIDHYETVLAPEVRSGGYGGGGIGSADSGNTDDEATGGGRLGLLAIPEPVMAADTNLDRAISAQEFQTAAQKRFALLDQDGGGRLTLSELQAERSAVRSNARRPRHDPNAPPPEMPTGDVPQMGGPG